MVEDELSVAMMRAALESGQRIRVRLWGHSMRPLIRPGSFLWIEPLHELSRIEPGDIGAHFGRTLTVHRIVSLEADRVFMAGDSDGVSVAVDPLELLGRVEGVAVCGAQLRVGRTLESAANRAVLRSLPCLRRSEAAVRHVASSQRELVSRLLSPGIVAAMSRGLRRAEPGDLPSLRRAWHRRARRVDQARLERWERAIAERRLWVWLMDGRLLVYALGEERFVHPMLRSPRLDWALDRQVT